jgi:hypothetical protein
MPSTSFTKPGEVLFNLLALLHVFALGLSAIFVSRMPDLALDWRFWALIAGPLVFCAGILAVFIRLRRSGYRPRFRFQRGLSITGSRACYDQYTGRYGRDHLIWLIASAVAYSLVSFVLAAVFAE